MVNIIKPFPTAIVFLKSPGFRILGGYHSILYKTLAGSDRFSTAGDGHLQNGAEEIVRQRIRLQHPPAQTLPYEESKSRSKEIKHLWLERCPVPFPAKLLRDRIDSARPGMATCRTGRRRSSANGYGFSILPPRLSRTKNRNPDPRKSSTYGSKGVRYLFPVPFPADLGIPGQASPGTLDSGFRRNDVKQDGKKFFTPSR
jgi:hypothetical protein